MPAAPLPEQIAAPSRLLLLAELRGLGEAAAGIALQPLLRLAPRGDGHPVLVLPGLVASDVSTGLMRRFLARRNFDAHGWGLGRNLGPRPGVEEAMVARLRALHDQHGRKVSLVGWSLGGMYARRLASAHPELVRGVITLGSPIVGSPRSTNAWRVYEGVSGRRAQEPQRVRRMSPTPPVPTTSIYSRSDGVVAWQCSVEQPGPQCENIEVVASHVGLGVHPAVLYALADRLAQPEGQWQPFRPGRLGTLAFPDPARPA
jgi:pimeloyl-ACP methyl ester carboxylesterase